MAKLNVTKIERKYIRLHGQIGDFETINKSVKVKYFSTFASPTNKSHDSLELLKELKPMRERAKASELHNLDSMLQRDLNDTRVARDLIPYLTSEASVAFFPAVLAVLMPKGFIKETEEREYPNPKVQMNEDSKIISYNDQWKLEVYKIEDEEITLGKLSIDTDSVDIVVLDGQHRANAFRVVSGTFDDVKNSIYSIFYKGLGAYSGFNADLPVTIIWFDTNNPKLDPRIVSRKLFIDVNNTAKKVSKSRTILLDELEISSLQTRFLYSDMAENRGFSTSDFSLFHSDFDLDSDINVSSNNVFAITNPQIVQDIFSWLTLGNTERYYESDCYGVGREAFRKSLDRFDNIFKESIFNSRKIHLEDESVNGKQVIINDHLEIKNFEDAFKSALGKVVLNVFSRFNLFRKHYEACKMVEEGVSEMDHVETSVWEEVFMGGEGLYYTFKDKNLHGDETLKKYLSAINSIENKLKVKRGILFNCPDHSLINQAFISVNSKAFQIALFMALDGYVGWENSLLDEHEVFIELLNRKSEMDWVYILTDIRRAVIKGTDPKKWPAYQKIIFRVIQNENFVYYDSSNFEHSPDGKVFYDNLVSSFNSWYDLNPEMVIEEMSLESIGKKELERWIEHAKDKTTALFEKAHISEIEGVDYAKYGTRIIRDLIENYKS